jgi:hypothetical protein
MATDDTSGSTCGSSCTTSSSSSTSDDSDHNGGHRVVTGLFGCCTATAIVSLLWMVTGSPWVVTIVSVGIMGLFMMENLAFYEEILALDGAIRVKDRKIESLKQALVDLTAMRDRLEETKRKGHAIVRCDSSMF